MTPSKTATSTVTTMTKGKLCMDVILLILIFTFGFVPSLMLAISTDSVTVICLVGGMGASWALAAMAVKLFGKEAEENIAILCFLFTVFYMVVIWAAEIGEYTVLSRHLILATDTMD
jgi:heme O synthase-like polyprenyltransferase